MKKPIAHQHAHEPLYRVVRRGWKDPLDTSFSQLTNDRRWNTKAFPALYCCCSTKVARAVTLDLFRYSGVVLDDLRPELRPQLVEIQWQGRTVDVVTTKGVRAAGFSADYPDRSSREQTQTAASLWHQKGWEGVVCRSASLHRLRFSDWSGDHERWSEIAIYTDRAVRSPKLIRRIPGLRWLHV